MAMNRIAAVVALAVFGAAGVQAQTSPYNDGVAHAQPSPPPPPASAGAQVDPAKSFDASVSQIERLWMGAAQAMPADKYSFAPSAAIFVPGQTVK